MPTRVVIEIGCEPGAEMCGFNCHMEGESSWCRGFSAVLRYDNVKDQNHRCEDCKAAERVAARCNCERDE